MVDDLHVSAFSPTRGSPPLPRRFPRTNTEIGTVQIRSTVRSFSPLTAVLSSLKGQPLGPLGKLRNDRYVPLHPQLVELLSAWTAANSEHIRRRRLLVCDERCPLDRHQVGCIVKGVGRPCGVSAHPHQLRHTLAPRPSTGGCGLRRWQRCSATGPWM